VAELPEKLMSCRFLPMSCWFLAQAAGTTPGHLQPGYTPRLAARPLPVLRCLVTPFRLPHCWSTEHCGSAAKRHRLRRLRQLHPLVRQLRAS
jgi:hypothetical protein